MVTTEEVVIDLLEDIMEEAKTDVILFLLIYIYIFIHLLIIICFNIFLLKGNKYWGKGYRGYPKYYDNERYDVPDYDPSLEDLCAFIPNPAELEPSDLCYDYWEETMNNLMTEDEDEDEPLDDEDEEDEEDEDEMMPDEPIDDEIEIPEVDDMVLF
jgi:hypothetical protein